MNKPTAPQRPVDLSVESVAGEEDPGASLEIPRVMGCPRCGGSGKLAGADCPECKGAGRVAGA